MLLLTTPFCIYGAGIVATSVYTAIRELFRQSPLFFLVSDTAETQDDDNPKEIDGIAVKRLSEWKRQLQELSPDCEMPERYLIAAPEIHHSDIAAALSTLGITDDKLLRITGELENELMEAYYRSLPECTTVSELTAAESDGSSAARRDRISQVQVFQAKSHMDRPLRGQNTGFNGEYILPIQVGAVLTEQRIADLQDNTGDNISTKNRNYCELTASYYAWKNSRAAYKGICHYRRIFDISDEQMQILLEKDSAWDVILPYPSIHYPDISAQHVRYVKEDDWEAMLQALGEVAPQYLDTYRQAVSAGERFFHNYNMLIARASVFDDYCGFLFRVLERTEELTAPRGWERADRFAGYLGENLTTLYFLHNRGQWKIAYAGKLWYQ